MKKTLIFISILTLVLINLSLQVFADQPPDPGGDPTGGNPVGGGSPIGGGLMIFIVAGISYGLTRVSKKLKNNI